MCLILSDSCLCMTFFGEKNLLWARVERHFLFSQFYVAHRPKSNGALFCLIVSKPFEHLIERETFLFFIYKRYFNLSLTIRHRLTEWIPTKKKKL